MKQWNNIDILIQLLASGSPERLQRDAFEKLYLFYWTPLRKYAEKRTDENLINDLLQDIFSDLWIQRKALVNEKIRDKSKLSKWLMDAVRSKCSNLNKVKRRQVRIEDESIAEEMAEKTMIYADQMEFTEQKIYEKKLCETIRKLPAELKLIYTLKRDYNYSMKEIASYLKISETQVKESFRKAKEMIEEKMLKMYQIDDFLSACKLKIKNKP